MTAWKFTCCVAAVLATLGVFPLCALADEPPAEDTIAKLSRSADEELAASVAELNQLREQIQAEQVPLAQELSALEDELTALRTEHTRVTRLVDLGALEMATIRNEIKARNDELSYVGGLLDEYAKSFESKVNVAELQYCGETLESAKQASANTTLSMTERFDRQVGLVDLTIKRVFDVIGGMRFAGAGVDLQGSIVEGEFAIIGPIALFRSNDAIGATAGLAVPQAGSTNPLIRPLEGQLQVGLANVVARGDGLLPLDPSLGGALQALVQKASLWHIFKKGGPIMWPLLGASVLALATVLERVLFLMREKWRRRPRDLGRFFTFVQDGKTQDAIQLGRKSKFYIVRALGYALDHRESSLANALVYAQEKELKRFQRGIPILDTVITLAPLLGLLGTVTGMMGSFSIIGGELSSPGAITGGIAEALIATAFGLGIAIVSLLPFNFLNARTEQARHEIESAATQLELIVQQQEANSAKSAPKPEVAIEVVKAGTRAALGDSKAQEDELRRRYDKLQQELAELMREFDRQTGADLGVSARRDADRDRDRMQEVEG